MISKLQYITGEVEGFSHPGLVFEACMAGCDWIQLRIKNMVEDKFINVAKQSLEICKEFNARLIINDNVQIAKRIGAHGVHIGKMDMDPIEARNYLGNNFLIGCSTNTFDDIFKLKDKAIDYVGLGPFRFTTTKEKLSPILGLDGLREIMKKCKEAKITIPVVAIGGIKAEDIESILDTGIHGIAVSSAISNADDKQKMTREILNKVNK